MRAVRLMVMFDLPTGNKQERRSYSDFRKFLIDDGYYREQFSVYSRVVLTRESSLAHIGRLRANLPKAGVVTVFELTEKKYESRIRLLNTSPEPHQQYAGAQLTLLL